MKWNLDNAIALLMVIAMLMVFLGFVLLAVVVALLIAAA